MENPLDRQSPAERKRILVVDDEKTIVFVLRLLLEKRLPGCIVESAFGGLDSMIKLDKFRPDLIILDGRMPDVDGLAVIREVRTNPNCRNTRILGFTGMSEEKELLMNAGADRVILKCSQESQPEQFMRTVTELLASKPSLQ